MSVRKTDGSFNKAEEFSDYLKNDEIEAQYFLLRGILSCIDRFKSSSKLFTLGRSSLRLPLRHLRFEITISYLKYLCQVFGCLILALCY